MVVENMFLLLSLAIIRLDKEPFDFFSFFFDSFHIGFLPVATRQVYRNVWKMKRNGINSKYNDENVQKASPNYHNAALK